MTALRTIDRNIRSIVTSAAKLNGLIHDTACLVLAHASEHGDCTRALTLVNAMPASMRRTMLKLWFETFSPIRFVMKDGLAVKVGILRDTAKTFTPYALDDAAAKPFYELAEANPEGKVLDYAALVKLVATLAGRIEKKIEQSEVVEADVPSAKAIAAALSALRFERITAPVNDDDAADAGSEPLRIVQAA